MKIWKAWWKKAEEEDESLAQAWWQKTVRVVKDLANKTRERKNMKQIPEDKRYVIERTEAYLKEWEKNNLIKALDSLTKLTEEEVTKIDKELKAESGHGK